MEKVCIYEMTLSHTGLTFFGGFEGGLVPPRFHAYADQNGDYSLVRLLPVIGSGPDVDYFIQTGGCEEVEVWTFEEMQEEINRRWPQGVRWFVQCREEPLVRFAE